MDIVSTTESTALKLEYSNKIIEAQNIRKDVLRLMKTNKIHKDNLSKGEQSALREIINDKEISIYPFVKGSGFVRIKKDYALEKICDQIGKTKILATDPTQSFTQKVKKILSQMNKNNRFTKKEYENIYPSDPIPPRMYGSIKAHPEKNYPMRIIVSTIETVTYVISEYLVKIIFRS